MPFSHQSVGSIDPDTQHTNLEGLVALFALFVGQLSVGNFFLIGRNFNDISGLAGALYLSIAVATIVAMGVVVGSHHKSTAEGTAMYAHDRGTVATGKWLLLFSTLLLVVFIKLAWANELPGMGHSPLQVTGTELYEIVAPDDDLNKKIPRVAMLAPVRPDQFAGRIPGRFVVQASFNGEECKKWYIADASLFRITPTQWKERVLANAIPDPGADPQEVEVSIPLPDTNYLLEMYLEPRELSDQKLSGMSDIEAEAAISKYKDRVKVIEEIKKQGSVELKVKE